MQSVRIGVAAVLWAATALIGACATTGETAPPNSGSPVSSQMSVSERLSDLDTKLAPGTPLKDVRAALGRESTVVPGRGSDKVYFFEFPRENGGAYRVAVIIKPDNTVMKYEVYETEAEGSTTRW